MAGMKVYLVLQVWALNDSTKMSMVECTEDDLNRYRSYLIKSDQSGFPTDVICIELQHLQQVIKTKPFRMFDRFKGIYPWDEPAERIPEDLPKEEPPKDENVFTEPSEQEATPTEEDPSLDAYRYQPTTSRNDPSYMDNLFLELFPDTPIKKEVSMGPAEAEEENAAGSGEGSGFERMAKRIKNKLAGKKI